VKDLNAFLQTQFTKRYLKFSKNKAATNEWQAISFKVLDAESERKYINSPKIM